MGAASVVIAILGLGGPPTAEVIARERPDLVPHGVTTRALADSAIAAAHPTHVATAAYTIDTACDRTYCVEELRAGRRVLIARAAALAALRRAVSDPGHEDEADATEVVVPLASAPGLLSVERIESDYTQGAA